MVVDKVKMLCKSNEKVLIHYMLTLDINEFQFIYSGIHSKYLTLPLGYE